MKIVYATDNYWPRVSGMAVSIDTFGEELAAMGHEVHVLAPDYPGSAHLDLQREYLTVHRFRSLGLFFSAEDRLVSPTEQGAVYRLLDDLQPDLVHTQTEMLMCRAAWRWARERHVPLVMTAHTHWEQYINHYLPFPPPAGRALVRAIMRSVLALGDAVVTPSSAMREILQGYGVTQPIEVIPTGFQHSAFEGVDRAEAKRSSPLFREHPQLQGRKVLLSVGRVAKEKNLGLVLDALQRLLPSMPELLWLVVGDGPALAPLRADVRRRGLTDNVITTGYLDRREVKHAFALADVLCLASTTETQGLVTVEALATGLPVVAVDAMGTHEVLANEEGGLLSAKDPAAFAGHVERLLTDELLLHRKAHEALIAAARFSPRALTERLLQTYQRLVGAPALPRHVTVAEASTNVRTGSQA